MLKAEESRKKLEKVLKEIESRFNLAEIRGSDFASFIFAEKGNRAIEIYQPENAVVVDSNAKRKGQCAV
jgi:hypothetical protein